MTDLIEPRMKSGGQRYAAVAAREGLAMERLLSPAVTTAARVGPVTFVSTVPPCRLGFHYTDLCVESLE